MKRLDCWFCLLASGSGRGVQSESIAFADIDRDGDQDVYAVMGGWYTCDGYRNVLFENPGHGNHWITLRLEGAQSNRAAIGARIRVAVNTAKGRREVHTVVSTGGSFGSTSLQQEIGLGAATSIEEVEIRWPATNASPQRFEDVPMDCELRVREGESAIEKL